MEKENPAMSKNTGAKVGSFLQNIGSKAGTLLKGFAVFVLVIGIISSIYMGIQTAISGDTVINRSDYFSEYNAKIKAQFRAAGFTTLIGGCIGSVFASLLILAFGQLVDEHIQIRKIMDWLSASLWMSTYRYGKSWNARRDCRTILNQKTHMLKLSRMKVLNLRRSMSSMTLLNLSCNTNPMIFLNLRCSMKPTKASL